MTSSINKVVEEYYSRKVCEHGATPRGVDWNSRESQEIRFDKLLSICEGSHGVSINDYGCGYGALLGHIVNSCSISTVQQYSGFDISRSMIAEAEKASNRLFDGRDVSVDARFTSDWSDLEVADFTLASGVFNVKLNINGQDWLAYILNHIKKLAALSKVGFGFNMLTKYSDAEKMRADLYYGDPTYFFDYIVRNITRHVAVLHDYGLYEFTILAKKS